MAELPRRRHPTGGGEHAGTSTSTMLATAILAVALVGMSLSRPLWSSASWTGAIGAAVTAAACVGLLHASLRLRALTMGALTAIIVLTAFWAKWMAASEPLKIYFIDVRFDNDLAIEVTGTLTLAFTLGWTAAKHLELSRFGTPETFDTDHGNATWLPSLAVLVVTALALCALRVAVAEIYSVGVPGQTPRGLDVPGLKTVIYYACIYGPLACASLVMLSRRSRPWLHWTAAGLVLLVYAAAGSYVGSRGATISAAIVPFFVLLAGPRSQAARLNPRQVLIWVAAAGVGLASLTIALTQRPVGASSSGPLGVFRFLEDRIGGLDFLSVAVSGVDRYGSSLTYFDTTTWVEFLTFRVYEYPLEAVTGAASTLPGTAFGVGGWLAVSLAGLLSGILIAIADLRCIRSTDPVAATWYLGLFLGWVNLLLEGTLYPTLLIILSFGSVYVLLLLVGQLRLFRRVEAGEVQRSLISRPTPLRRGARRSLRK